MKRILMALALIAAAGIVPAQATDVGVSVTIGQPGFYGRIDIGDYPYPVPRVIYREPRIIQHIVVEREPVYLRVPPGHRKHWRKYCRQYGACGERVYFVRDDWYLHEFAPHYRERHHRHSHRDDHRDGRGDDRWDHDRRHDGNGRHDHKPGRDHDR